MKERYGRQFNSPLMSIILISVFIVGITISMLFYNGGSLYNSKYLPYQFIGNFYSDLGRTTGFDGSQNFLSMITFILAMFGAAFSFFTFYQRIFQRISLSNIKNLFLTIYKILIYILTISVIGIAVTPWDILYTPHIIFVDIGFVSMFIVCLISGLISLAKSLFKRWFSLTLIIMSVLFFLYILLLLFGPEAFSSPWAAFVQSAGQKLIVFISVFLVLIGSFLEKRNITTPSSG